RREISIPAPLLSGTTKLQSRPVTIGEYLYFLTETQPHLPEMDLRPTTWTPDNLHVKTAFGLVELSRVPNWPVYCSGAQAAIYAQVLSKKDGKTWRLPSEFELVCARKFGKTNGMPGNFGFASWTPRDVEENGVVGNGWELTGTCMAAHEGYEKSVSYPGYSSDFFDGKHDIVFGASWATAPRLAVRSTLRNWYQRIYPYVFATFRLACDEQGGEAGVRRSRSSRGY
ncbi:hypothetical protein HDU98_007258, partial [Podochytrium sp. JEL0797]